MQKRYSPLERIFSTHPGQLNLASLFVFVGIIIFALFIAVNIQRFSPLIVLAAVMGLVVGILTLINTNFGLMILIFSMLWSPEIPIAGTIERAVTVRVDDFLIITVFFTWVAKMALTRQTGFIKHTPLNKPIMAYLGTSVFSTALGITAGNVNPKTSFFYILKYCEYFMVYFLFVNNINDMKQLKTFIFCFLLTSFSIGIFTYAQMGAADRPTTPFEGEHGEPNTLGGYLLLCLAVTAGLFLSLKFSFIKVLLGGLVCFNLMPIVVTLSRSSYLGLSIAYLLLIIITRRGKFLLMSILVLMILFFPLIVPKAAMQRILYTFSGIGGGERFKTAGGLTITLEGSAATRVRNYQYALDHLKKKPFFGFGVTGVGLVDSQYARFLAELGMVGFAIFCFLIFSLIKNIWRAYNSSEDDFGAGLSLGLLCGVFGLLFVGIGTSIFVIVRISEPLWFLVACVMVLPEIYQYPPLEGREV